MSGLSLYNLAWLWNTSEFVLSQSAFLDSFIRGKTIRMPKKSGNLNEPFYVRCYQLENG